MQRSILMYNVKILVRFVVFYELKYCSTCCVFKMLHSVIAIYCISCKILSTLICCDENQVVSFSCIIHSCIILIHSYMINGT